MHCCCCLQWSPHDRRCTWHRFPNIQPRRHWCPHGQRSPVRSGQVRRCIDNDPDSKTQNKQCCYWPCMQHSHSFNTWVVGLWIVYPRCANMRNPPGLSLRWSHDAPQSARIWSMIKSPCIPVRMKSRKRTKVTAVSAYQHVQAIISAHVSRRKQHRITAAEMQCLIAHMSRRRTHIWASYWRV